MNVSEFIRRDITPVIGISPRNPYFKKTANVLFALEKVLAVYPHAVLFVPGNLDRYNFLAYGENEENAFRKAAASRGKLQEVMREVCSHTSSNVAIVECGAYISDPRFQVSFESFHRLYDSNVHFRKDVNKAALLSLTSHLSVNSRDRKRIEHMGVAQALAWAKEYLLGELAFLNKASSLLNTNKVVYHYHQSWPVYENLIAGNYDDCERSELTFCLLKRDATPV